MFTQEDPIGLAGGLNLYGFAGGDPINFSDPFGLCPPEDDDPCNMETGDPILDTPESRQELENSFKQAPLDEIGYHKELGGSCTAELACQYAEGTRDGVSIPVTRETAFDFHAHPNAGRPIPDGKPGAVYPAGPSEDKDIASAFALMSVGFHHPSYVVAPNTIYRLTPAANGVDLLLTSFPRWKNP